MAIRISRNTQAPAEFAGRAASPTMRFSGATLNAEKQAIAAEGEVTKLAFNAGTSIASGLAAGFSGQTTEDLASIATGGQMADGSDVKDVNDFQVGKFMNETISSLGGVGGLMEGVEKQNVAINMVDNYQKGVAIGEAHVKQQSEMVVMTASTTAEANFREDMAKGKYDGAVNRSWQSHQDALTKAMNDPNTTPAVRSKIQAYMSSDIAKAKFDNQYVAKEANAIAKRTAKNAEATMGVAVKNGDTVRVNELKMSQKKEIFRTPQQEDDLDKQAKHNNNMNRINSSTSRILIDEEIDRIKEDPSLTSTEKTYFNGLATTAKNKVKAESLESLAGMRNESYFETQAQIELAKGNFDSPKQMQTFINNNKYGTGTKASPQQIYDVQGLFSGVKTQSEFDDAYNKAIVLKEGGNLDPAGKKQLNSVISEGTTYFEALKGAAGSRLDDYMTSLMAESSTGAREEAGIPELDDPFEVTKEVDWWLDKDMELNSMTRKSEFDYSVGKLKHETMRMASEEGEIKAQTHFNDKYSKLVKNANMPIWNRQFEQIYTASSQRGTRSFGSPKRILRAKKSSTDIKLGNINEYTTESELRESKEAERNKRKEERDKKKFPTSYEFIQTSIPFGGR